MIWWLCDDFHCFSALLWTCVYDIEVPKLSYSLEVKTKLVFSYKSMHVDNHPLPWRKIDKVIGHPDRSFRHIMTFQALHWFSAFLKLRSFWTNHPIMLTKQQVSAFLRRDHISNLKWCFRLFPEPGLVILFCFLHKSQLFNGPRSSPAGTKRR